MKPDENRARPDIHKRLKLHDTKPSVNTNTKARPDVMPSPITFDGFNDTKSRCRLADHKEASMTTKMEKRTCIGSVRVKTPQKIAPLKVSSKKLGHFLTTTQKSFKLVFKLSWK